jgi:hypothetical protein
MLKRLTLAAAALALAILGLGAINPHWAEPVIWFAKFLRSEALAAEPAKGDAPLPKLVLDDATVDPGAQTAYVTARLVPETPPTTTVIAEVFTRNGSDMDPARRAGLPPVRRLVVFRAGDPPVQSVAIPLRQVRRKDAGAWFEVLAPNGNTGLTDNRILARVTFKPSAANRPVAFAGRAEAGPRKGALVYSLDPATFRASDNGGEGVARTRYSFGRWPVGDIGYYTDPVLHPGTRAWEVRGGELILRGEKLSRPLEVEVGGRKRSFAYSSSVLEWPWLAQKYGYYEVEAMTSGARGTWSAFWLLPADDGWPPEIDIFEHPRNGQVTPGHTTAANHWTDAKGRHQSRNAHIDLAALLGKPVDTTREFHTYGVDWRADYTTYYFDGREIWRTPTRFHKPAFPILDVAIAGKWAGQPDLSTGTNEMRVRALRIWK